MRTGRSTLSVDRPVGPGLNLLDPLTDALCNFALFSSGTLHLAQELAKLALAEHRQRSVLGKALPAIARVDAERDQLLAWSLFT